MTRGAMDGVSILDFTWVAVGPITTKYFADNGAHVVKIESSVSLDGMRDWPPWPNGEPDINRSQSFANFNSSKKSVSLNMSSPAAREIVAALVPHFDVVTESFTPGTMARWGLGFDDLRELRSDIIMLSTCMQGQTGPRSRFPGYGQLAAALMGFYFLSGYSEDEIAPPYGAYTDVVAPKFAALALLGALEYRRRTGQGQHIDLSQQEAALQFLGPALADYFSSGTIVRPQANRSDRYAPHGAYRCAQYDEADRWIAIAVANDEEWLALLGVLGVGGGPPALSTALARLENPDEVDAYVQALVAQWTAAELAQALQGAGVAAYPVQNCVDLVGDENLWAFDFWPWLEKDDAGTTPYQGLSYRLEGTPSQQSVAPNLGQHNDEILGDLLGLSGAEIEQLKTDGVIR